MNAGGSHIMVSICTGVWGGLNSDIPLNRPASAEGSEWKRGKSDTQNDRDGEREKTRNKN